MTKRIYWDTSVFLCFLNKEEEERRKICEDVLQSAQKDLIHIYTSTYTIAEVIHPKRKSIPSARRLTADEVEKIRSMFKWPFITTIELDERTAQFAVCLARDLGLQPADAVHSASAILWKLEALQAWDRDFSAIADKIPVENPTYFSAQAKLELLPPVGPTPEDFEDAKAADEKPKSEPKPPELPGGGDEHSEDQATAEASPSAGGAQTEGDRPAGESKAAALASAGTKLASAGTKNERPADEVPLGEGNGLKPILNTKGIEPSPSESREPLPQEPEDKPPVSPRTLRD